MMTIAINDMETAYTDAACRTGPGSTFVGVGAGDISGLTLTRGIYKWSTDVKFNTDLTLTSSATGVWIMQIAGTFTAGPGAKVILADGAQAENIFWAIADALAFDDGSHGEGIFLAKTMISFNAGSSLYGAAFAQTAVTMISTDIEAVMVSLLI
ncbi:Ig-like protein, group 2 [Fragilariopsis cylindrus CCMP1102]|uniref:Ig-like protein, group 2 n=1 Tax=Fragilariopsis cylindrus CCMP1102 TaxID=635003 RepID=A0A1E7EZE6_9STRA|nr:Ig-like protein, group 2 [Fragilariopsis cylindrus CCMP1102]|eukprot:OEU11378.1 Ig-like protein, group 2 [Fragilariopsis cylindrus CCMP1102]